MSLQNGLPILGGYVPTVLTTAGDTALVQAEIAKLIAIIPDPDVAPANTGGVVASNLDQMYPQTAAQLLVDLAALSASFSDA